MRVARKRLFRFGEGEGSAVGWLAGKSLGEQGREDRSRAAEWFSSMLLQNVKLS